MKYTEALKKKFLNAVVVSLCKGGRLVLLTSTGVKIVTLPVWAKLDGDRILAKTSGEVVAEMPGLAVNAELRLADGGLLTALPVVAASSHGFESCMVMAPTNYVGDDSIIRDVNVEVRLKLDGIFNLLLGLL